MSIRKNSTIALIAVLGSRVLGLVREIIFASFFGASFVLDAFIAAFRIPNLLRDLFAEGALSQSFVTIFSKVETKEGDQKSWELANHIFGFIILVIGILATLGILFSPYIVKFVAPGFSDEKYNLTVHLNQILFGFILFVSLASVAMGMLNTKGKFALPQSASTFFNFTSITCGILFSYLYEPLYISSIWNHFLDSSTIISGSPEKAILGMAWGTILGGFVQWFIQMPSLFKLGYRFKPKINFRNSHFKDVMKLTGPAIIGGAAVQVNVLVNTNFASFLTDGSISWLAFAFRLMQFPLGVFGVSIAIAATPILAKYLAQNNTTDFKKSLTDSIEMNFFLCIPAAFGLAFFADHVVALIYQHGKFSVEDSLQTTYALQAYLVGLPFYALIKIYQPAFLAFGDAKTPMKVSLSSIIINAIAGYLLVFKFHFSHWGLALGTSCVAIYNLLLLTFLFRKKLKEIWTREILIHLIKVLFATSISISISYVIMNDFIDNSIDSSLLDRMINTLLIVVISGMTYLGTAYLIKIKEIKLIREKFRKN